MAPIDIPDDHQRCFVCGPANPAGLQLCFEPVDGDGEHGIVQAVYQPNATYAGFDNVLHGGIVGALLDAAMANAFFLQRLTGRTALMQVKFRAPIHLDAPITLRGWIAREDAPRYDAAAELHQDDQLKASATGVYIRDA